MDDDSTGDDDIHAVDWDDDTDMMAAAVLVIANMNEVMMDSIMDAYEQEQERERIQLMEDILTPSQAYRHQPRRPKAIFRHHEALWCIQRDYFGIAGDLSTPIFKDKNFEMMFRLSRTRVQRIFEDVMNAQHPFYACNSDATGKKGASLEAKILLPLKTCAFGTAEHAFCDYFQMSHALASKCCEEYAKMMRQVYGAEYLRIPDENDIKKITQLHSEAHGVPGMFGCLDCMHTRWKNCPKAWQQSYKSGKESGGPTVVLEALSDYHLWFWHASFGYAGSLNDLNILNLSPLLESLVDGSFAKLEERAGIVPFDIGGEQFNRLFALVDGIYPRYSRFVKGIQVPLTHSEKAYTAWQEAARKDIERAFGVLQSRFQIMARPFQSHSLIKISNTAAACLIMHNMCVSDRVMDGNVYAVYDPSYSVAERETLELDMIPIGESNREYGHGENEHDNADFEEFAAPIGLGNGANEFVVQHMLARQDNWKGLNDQYEHARLHAALKRVKGGE